MAVRTLCLALAAGLALTTSSACRAPAPPPLEGLHLAPENPAPWRYDGSTLAGRSYRMLDRLEYLAGELPPHNLPHTVDPTAWAAAPDGNAPIGSGALIEIITFPELPWSPWPATEKNKSAVEPDAAEQGLVTPPPVSTGTTKPISRLWATPFPAPALLTTSGELPPGGLEKITVYIGEQKALFGRYPDPYIHPPGRWSLQDGYLIVTTDLESSPGRVRFQAERSREDLQTWHVCLWDGPATTFVRRRIEIADVTRESIYLPTPGRLEDQLVIPSEAHIETAIGIARPPSLDLGDGVVFVIGFRDDLDGKVHMLLERVLDPRQPGDQKWQPVTVDLTHLAGRAGTLFLETRQRGSTQSDYAAFADPRLVTAEEGGSDYPNLVLILADTLRPDYLSCFGGPVPTPNLDHLVADSNAFSSAISTSSWTGPALASIFTGLYPTVFGLEKLAYLGNAPPALTAVSHLIEGLRQRGWNTWGFQTNPVLKGERWAYGFDEYRFEADASADRVSGVALEWLKQKPRQPFVAYLHYLDPHLPYTYHPTVDQAPVTSTDTSPLKVNETLAPSIDNHRPSLGDALDSSAGNSHPAPANKGLSAPVENHKRSPNDSVGTSIATQPLKHPPGLETGSGQSLGTHIDPGELARQIEAVFEREMKAGRGPDDALPNPPSAVAKLADTPEKRAVFKDLYAGEVRYLDTYVGALYQTLEEAGLLDHTVLALFSDHGEEFWEHGGFEHGHSFHQEVSRVLFVVRPPGPAHTTQAPAPRPPSATERGLEEERGRTGDGRLVEDEALQASDRLTTGGRISQARASLIDVLPTLWGLLSVAPPNTLPGRNLLETLEPDLKTRTFFGEAVLYGPPQHAVYTNQWTLIQNEGVPARLYDRGKDSLELYDQASGNPEVVRTLSGEYDSHLKVCTERKETIARESPASPSTTTLDATTREQLKALGYLE